YGDRLNDDRDYVSVPKDDPMQKQVQPVPIRAGSLLIWNSKQPHCNYANDSDQFRMVQYIKMFPVRDHKNKYETFCKIRKERMRLDLPDGFEPNEFGKKVLGLKWWN